MGSNGVAMMGIDGLGGCPSILKTHGHVHFKGVLNRLLRVFRHVTMVMSNVTMGNHLREFLP